MDTDMLTASRGTGLKGKLFALEDVITKQNEELANQRLEIDLLRHDKEGIEEQFRHAITEMKKTLVTDMNRIDEESKRFLNQQKADNARFQQQIIGLKADKTSLQQQILGLQRRIQEIEEQIGHE